MFFFTLCICLIDLWSDKVERERYINDTQIWTSPLTDMSRYLGFPVSVECEEAKNNCFSFIRL